MSASEHCDKSPDGKHSWNDALIFSDPAIIAMCEYCEQVIREVQAQQDDD